MRQITTADVAELLDRLRERGRSEKTIAGALATLESVMRFAVRNGWIADSPIGKLETDERPHPARRTQRVLGREEIARLMGACLPTYRALIATALLTGMRLSELLGLIWDDIDLVGGSVHVRAQLSRAPTDAPARRVAPKTPSAARHIPLAPQLATVLREHRSASTHAAGSDWAFATRNGTPLSLAFADGQRAVEREPLSPGDQVPSDSRFEDARGPTVRELRCVQRRLSPGGG